MKRISVTTTKNKIVKCLCLAIVLMVFCLSQTSCDELPFLEKKCEATTKKGEPCTYKAAKNSKYCRIHKSKGKKRTTKKRTTKKRSTSSSTSKKKCKAKTESGKRCSRKATYYGYCTQHYRAQKR